MFTGNRALARRPHLVTASTSPVSPAAEPIPPPDVATAPPRGLARLGSALRSRNFRILWSANILSTSGTWMQRVAQNWLVLTVSGSAFYLGLDGFLGELPILLFTLVGGVIADRHDRRYLLIGSQAVQLTCAFVLATLVYFEVIRIWHVLALSFTTGMAQAFGGPAYQSLVPSLVPRQDLPNAIALNSIQFNLARILGPLIAGLALTAFGMAVCFALNGLSFLFVIAALLALRFDHPAQTAHRSIFEEMKTGLSYVAARPALVTLTTLGFLATFLGLPLQTLLPVIVREVFGQGVDGYSRMMACSGAGAVAGALIVAWKGRYAHMGRTALMVQGLFGLLVIAFSFSRVLALSYVLLFLGGVALIILTSTLVSLAQLIAPDQMRGRVMSVFMVAFRGGMPLGSLAAGSLASVTSAPLVLTVAGVLLMGLSAWFLTQSHGVREI
jgi:MFS family permease